MKISALTALLITTMAAGSAFACDEMGEHRGMKGQVMSECAKEAGVEIPKDGPRHEIMSKLTPEQRSKLRSCMMEKGMGHGGKGKTHEHSEKS